MASANDMKAAKETYAGFIAAVKYSTPLIALIAAGVVYLISR
ncbi:aa3-type cytochrome c oxidase subunit IV [Novosphingobium flavum]|uniref:Aa3-type cytochrome c oxidase subunit IV n=1 Tax=Novosphingobium flavum TaxID=1778672 RepID=A0A7X1KKX3_9SPHN|nr:aa3-type cytochrome c oxidase subunit IV [Novosphingobium flavum]MBC2665009.1 aa3-type cytochrome c oxidase subunit IV [Novosphingobium flavum]